MKQTIESRLKRLEETVGVKKVLEIALDQGTWHTRYVTLNPEVGKGSDAVFFDKTNGVQPLKLAKEWAKKNGFTHLEVIDLRNNNRNKIYEL